MKRVVVLLLAIASVSVNAQEGFNEKWLEIQFQEREDYKNYEKEILGCAGYILSVPMNDFNRQNALTLVARWMSGTPDYNFIIGPRLEKLTESSEFILSIYMASAVQCVLESSEALEPEEVELAAYRRMLKYVQERDHNFRITKEIQKVIDAEKKGKLKEYISR